MRGGVLADPNQREWIERAIADNSRVYLTVDAATAVFRLLGDPTPEEALETFAGLHLANFTADIVFLNGAFSGLKVLG